MIAPGERLPSSGGPDALAPLREEVRAFVREEDQTGGFIPRCDAWLVGYAPDFSRKLGDRGWLGMTWSERYGGHERSALERIAVVEELLVAGAPVAAHWIADRQSGPQIFRHGTEPLKAELLPLIARGECYFALGLSEPDSGSDLASVRTRAVRSAGGWRVSGQKLWSSGAHHAHYITVLCRTSGSPSDRQSGLSLFVVDLHAPGVTVRPIHLLSGEHHFNEVLFEDVPVQDHMLLGEEGSGWSLVTGELSLERSGPERYLSTFLLLREYMRSLAHAPDLRAATDVGTLIAEIWTLHHMSSSIAAELDSGSDPVVTAAAFKDLGTRFERRLIETVRGLYPTEPSLGSADRLSVLLAEAVLAAPGFTLRGGTNEILRSIVARGLGVR